MIHPAGPIVLILGAALDGLMYWLIQKKREKISHWNKTEGVVVGWNQSSSDGTTTYAPVAEFTDAQGTSRTYESGLYSSPKSHKMGQTVKIAYDPEDPDDAEILSVGQMYFAHIIGLVFGTIALLIGSVVCFAS